MRTINVQYELTVSQFMAACAAHWRAHKQGTWSCIRIGVLGAAIGCVVVIVSPCWGLTKWVAMAIVVTSVMLLAIPPIRYGLWRRAFLQSPKYSAPIDVSFTLETIHVESAQGVSDLNWSFYDRYLDVPDYILLYITKHQFSVIPKAAFDDPQQLQALKKLLETKLEKVA